MTTLREINQQFKLGKLPECLDFSFKQPDAIDWTKVSYNTFYKSPEFWLNKFDNPTALLNLPGGTEIIQSLIDNAKTPLEEMEDLQNIGTSFTYVNINIYTENIDDGLDKSTETSEPTHCFQE